MRNRSIHPIEPFSLVAVQFAKEPRDTPVKVNAAAPGFTATDLNGHSGTRTVE
jgi:NAD(P)-dependent dehydrogenase (short-subunit alcohol dehydrogenase family)